MADNQRIHPVEAEASTSDPLPPSSEPLPTTESFRSEKDESDHEIPAEGLTLPDPEPDQEAPSNRRRCYKCLCWTAIVFLVLIILIGVIIGILFLIFRPKIPKYSFDSLMITDFQIKPNLSVYARFDLKITTRNPNKRIGIYYERGSNVSVWYTNISLCTGSLPNFYQGHRNTTILHVILTGEVQFSSTVVAELQEQQRMGRIPLDFKARVPVRVKLGKLKLWKMRFWVWCKLAVSRLSANNLINISTSICHKRFKI
ncbi:NDR1/HIN1-like protein 6 [Magnolia sinica]|uniref:NDR1/HIN1-like protein 6 n=1 Tax=Magnolia sinica TaxID=86752 RepID=UPI002659F095|nr:NDR1/HIN1-like protein 6 [Magnolia sinica]